MSNASLSPWPSTLPLVLVCGAAAVIATAATLSWHAARQPDLPSQRWSRALPAWITRMADAEATRATLAIVGLLAVTIGCGALALARSPVDGMVAVAVLTALTLVTGPFLRAVNPLHALRRSATMSSARAASAHDRSTAAADPATELRSTVVWLVAVFAVLLSTSDPRVLAVTASAYVVIQALLARWHDRPSDPIDVLVELFGHLAPVGRTAGGVLAWRNPIVEVAHAALPASAVAVLTTVIAASVAHALLGPADADPGVTRLDGSVRRLLLFAGVGAAIAVVLRVSVIRPFMRSAVIPLGAGYGLMAGGPWWSPLDLGAFVALHMTAIAVLHRQAVARHDVRTARAVQFPLRIIVLSSVLLGLALFASRAR